MSAEHDRLAREFDLLMTSSGVVVPAERRSGAVAVFRDLKRMTLLLRQPRSAASEPSNVYRLSVSNHGSER